LDAGARKPWTVLGLMLLAQVMVILDVSVVNVALPSIGEDLDFTSGDFQWVVSAYVLMSGGFLLLGGRVADLRNRRTMFLAGLGVFTAASMASGLASSAGMLIASRAAQGLGAALLTPAAMALIMTTYTGKQRAAALSVWGAIGSSGIAAGVLFGGLLTSAVSWQAVFFINVPIGIVAAAGTLATVPATRAASTGGVGRGQLDVIGALSLVAGLVCLVYGVEGTRSHGWTSAHTWGALAASAALLAVFALAERKVPAPLVPPRTWRIRSLVSASTVMAGVTGVVVGAIFLLSLYLQRIVGSSAVVTGLEFLPLAAAITLTAALASKALGHAGPRALIAGGIVVMAAGAALLAYRSGGSSYAADVLPGLLLLGAGCGPMFVAISVAAMSDVSAADAGLGSGLRMTGHEVGAALGVAVLTAVGGDLTTSAGLVDATSRAFVAIVVALGGLMVVTLAAVPARLAGSAHPGGMHH
jgi:EmrB/QacA subfamily drug resistance transporter